MLYAFYGSDVVGVRKKAFEALHTFEEKGCVVERITPEIYSDGLLVDLAGAVSLFGGEQVVLLDTPSGSSEVFEAVFKNLELLSESTTTFLLIEEKLLAPEKKKLAKHAVENIECDAGKRESFSPFALADALLRKDKKSLWMLLVEAWRSGLSNEEIIGTLYWQVKMLRLADRTKTTGEAGQKPFVYNKSKSALAKFKEGEVDVISRDLLSMYHDGHLGKRDLSIALERWVLSL